jgi:hypothetical protein
MIALAESPAMLRPHRELAGRLEDAGESRMV